MNVRFATERDNHQWDNVVSSSSQGSFLQSWAWGDTQLKLGVQIWRLVVEENGQWKAAALVLARPQPFGRSWLYAPRGPVFAAAAGKPVWDPLQEKLIELAEAQKAIFIRIDPPMLESVAGAAQLVELGWRKAEREVQPKHTLVLDLTKSEEELLSSMHQKTRYNIRLAQKKGVTVRFSHDVADVEHFLRLAQEVSARTTFSFHPDTYYRVIMEVLGKVNLAELVLAEFQGEVLAAHMVVTFGGTATYLHGASSSRSREIMAPQFLQWETIRRAKAAGQVNYDFFGVAPEGADTTHPWAGITRFKLGFGGNRVNYLGAYDLVLHGGMYHIFNTARRFKTLLR